MSIERIKFRGKATKRFQILTEHDVFLRTIECGQWVTTDDFIGAENTALANSDADRFAKFFEHVAVGLIDPATVGQWTGLKDTNGVEIFEGDIIQDGLFIAFCDKCKSFEPFWYSQEDTIESRYLGECFNCDGEVGWWELVDGPNEVIGNVHEVTK